MSAAVLADVQATPERRRWRSVGEIVAALPREATTTCTIGRPTRGSLSPSHVRFVLREQPHSGGLCLVCGREIDEGQPWVEIILRDDRDDVCIDCTCVEAVVMRARLARRFAFVQAEMVEQFRTAATDPESQSGWENMCHIRDLRFFQQVLAYGVAVTPASAHALFDAAVRA